MLTVMKKVERWVDVVDIFLGWVLLHLVLLPVRFRTSLHRRNRTPEARSARRDHLVSEYPGTNAHVGIRAAITFPQWIAP